MTVIICADDFGFNEAISKGIVELLQAQKIQATSCMTNMPYWPTAAQLLTVIKGAEIGLHFNLTDGKPLTELPASHFGSLKQLLINSHLRRLNQTAIAQEFNAQLDAFIEHHGTLPDFIDGHQHVHQFPVIQQAMLSVYQQRLIEKKPWIRVSANPLSSILTQPKALIIALTGALTLKKRLTKLSIPHNQHFAGIYDFNPDCDYGKLFKGFLRAVNNDGLIMCHPAHPDFDDSSDTIKQARINEYHYLSTR